VPSLAVGDDVGRDTGGCGAVDADRLRPTTKPTEMEANMDLLEISQKERLSREEAAARLHTLADVLARNNEVEFERNGLRFKVHVPDEVDFKLEIEIGDDERELEVELTW
jgi:amphi-Trp domain-containing protein